MSEVYNMFSYAGINIPEQEIENLFFRASSKQANNKAFQSQLRFKSAETMKHKFIFLFIFVCFATRHTKRKDKKRAGKIYVSLSCFPILFFFTNLLLLQLFFFLELSS
jgi:hypothetical protein